MPTGKSNWAYELGYRLGKQADQQAFSNTLAGLANALDPQHKYDKLDPGGRLAAQQARGSAAAAPAVKPAPATAVASKPAPAASPAVPRVFSPPVQTASQQPAKPWYQRRVVPEVAGAPLRQLAGTGAFKWFTGMHPSDEAAARAHAAGDPKWWMKREPGIRSNPAAAVSGIVLPAAPGIGSARRLLATDAAAGASAGGALEGTPQGIAQGLVSALPAGEEAWNYFSGSPEFYGYDPDRFRYETLLGVPAENRPRARPGAMSGQWMDAPLFLNELYTNPVRTLRNTAGIVMGG